MSRASAVYNTGDHGDAFSAVTSPSGTVSPADMVRSAKTRRSPARQTCTDMCASSHRFSTHTQTWARHFPSAKRDVTCRKRR